MPGGITPTVIEKRYAGEEAQDYQFLFQKGVELIQQFSGGTWTDYNLHDPGITILEYLCFAITDLAYRTGQPLDDLLSRPYGGIDAGQNSFIPRQDILSAAPVTPADYRKLIIDRIPEVNNVDIIPALSDFTAAHTKGFYRVKVLAALPHGLDDATAAAYEADTLRKVYALLQEQRQIGECFEYPVALKPQPIVVQAAVRVNNHKMPEQLLAAIYEAVESCLTPAAKYHSEPELRNAGLTTDEIFQGPLLHHGFLRDEDLPKHITEVDPSTLIRVINAVPGVIGVLSLSLLINGESNPRAVYTLPPGAYPRLQVDVLSPSVQLYAENHPLAIRTNVFNRLLVRQHEQRMRSSAQPDSVATEQPAALHGRASEYVSFQRLLPPVYRTRYDDPGMSSDPASRAKVRQLKGYLLFFEQVLANYQAQLQQFGRLYAPVAAGSSFNTYAVGNLYDVPGISYLLKDFDRNAESWEAFAKDAQNGYLRKVADINESDGQFVIRKRKLLRHILSRFNINPDVYPVLIYDSAYGDEKVQTRETTEIAWLSALVADIADFTARRMQVSVPDAEGRYPLAGFERNMALLLHLPLRNNYWLSRVPAALMSGQGGIVPAQQQSVLSTTLRRVMWQGEPLRVAYVMNPATRRGFRFSLQGTDFFRHAADHRNFMIIADPDNPAEQLVLYSNPDDVAWQIVRRYSRRAEAAAGIEEWISALTANNIQAEGFHLVEHCLLAPALDAPVYGFRFLDERGRPMFRQKNRNTFEGREAALRDLHHVIMARAATDDDCIEAIAAACDVMIFRSGALHFEDVRQAVADSQRIRKTVLDIVRAIRLFEGRPGQIYPKYVFDVATEKGAVIDERFFDISISVVLPAWPARFQQEGFREFLARTFRQHLPAHMHVHFYWLGILALGRFESCYAAWRPIIQDDAGTVEQHARSAEMLEMMLTLNPAQDESGG